MNLKATLSAFALSTAAVLLLAAETTVQWPATEMDTFEGVKAVAQATTHIIVLEAWNDKTLSNAIVVPPAVDGEISNVISNKIEPNPERVIIPRPHTTMTFSRGLDHVVESHGRLTRLPGDIRAPINLVRAELLKNPEWPLNKKLRPEDLTSTVTLGSAKKLLSESYGLTLPPEGSSSFLGIQRGDDHEICSGTSLKDGTVRDLVNRLIIETGARGAVFEIIPFPSELTSAENATAHNLRWAVRQMLH